MSAPGPEGRSLAQWLAYQQRVHPQSIDLELSRVREVAARLGLLPARCPVVTVAGTNGKGSTATCVAQLLEVCGARVGLFTSPHLLRYTERVRIGGRQAGAAELVSAFERVEQARAAITLTFFEYSTLAALVLFREAQVDAMVLEVGMGGRLDATNIIDADVAVLCSVGLDHRDWLGETLEDIGAQKAGIFRAGCPAVLGSEQMPATVWRAAGALGCELWVAGRQFDWQVGPGGWAYRGPLCSLAGLPAPALAGEIQYRNAATALTAVQLLARRPQTQGLPAWARICDPAQVGAALQALELPGRFQVMPGEVEWVLDVAHNEPAAQVLRAALGARGPARRTLAIAGMLADKNIAAVAGVLDELIDEWLLVDLHAEQRGMSAAQLRQRLPGNLRGSIRLAGDAAQACATARACARPGDRVLVFGSFHVVGPALQWLGLY